MREREREMVRIWMILPIVIYIKLSSTKEINVFNCLMMSTFSSVFSRISPIWNSAAEYTSDFTFSNNYENLRTIAKIVGDLIFWKNQTLPTIFVQCPISDVFSHDKSNAGNSKSTSPIV